MALAGGCGGGTKTSTTPTGGSQPASTTPTSAAAEAPCKEVQAPATKSEDAKKPKGKLDTKKTYAVTFVTNCGSFSVELNAKDQPRTSASFLNLAEKGFYDGLGFHRIAPGFVIQGGDPLGNGSGGPGYKVVEEPPQDTQYVRGTVAMAKAGTEAPGTSGSQFFVVTGDGVQLPPEYALVGKVTEGMESVDRIEDLGVPGQDGPPSQPAVIESAQVNTG